MCTDVKVLNTLPTQFFAFVIGGQLWGRQGAYYKIEKRQRRGYEENRNWLKNRKRKERSRESIIIKFFLIIKKEGKTVI